MVYTMFAVGVKDNHNLVSNSVVVRFAFSILLFVVLKDTFLLTFLDVVPICLKGNIEHCVSSEH